MVLYNVFMEIQRFLTQRLQKELEAGKVVILYGPRRVGKTTLIHSLLGKLAYQHRLVSGDEITYRQDLASQNKRILAQFVEGVELLVIDEAQRIENIGLNLKILVDNFPTIRFIATGSASLDLANKISEPLTGRKKTFTLYPVGFAELAATYGTFEARERLEEWLIWGTYPEVVTIGEKERKKSYLDELAGSYLYKDILELEGIRYPGKIADLLRLLAFQIGQEVSLSELAANLAINRETVERYLYLLEQSFVIFQVRGFSRNLRKEVVKNHRWYFYDNGIRNSLIQNFNGLTLRNDTGQLWENFLAVERRKANQAQNRLVNTYFWRTYDQKEIDLIEEGEGKLWAFELKWQGELRKSTKKAFAQAYPGAHVATVTKDSFEPFISPPRSH